MKPTKHTATAIAILMLCSMTAFSQSSVEWRSYLRQLEAAKDNAAKGLAASEQALAMSQAALQTAQSNTKQEPIYDWKNVEEWVTYCDGRKRREINRRKVQTGTRTITDSRVPTLTGEVAFYQAQVSSGKLSLGQYDPKIAEAKQKIEAAVQREQVAAAASSQRSAVSVQSAPAAVTAPAVAEAPVESTTSLQPSITPTPTVKEPFYKNAWVWVGGGVFVLLGIRYVLGRATD